MCFLIFADSRSESLHTFNNPMECGQVQIFPPITGLMQEEYNGDLIIHNIRPKVLKSVIDNFIGFCVGY